MKKKILFYFLLFFIQSIIYSQSIEFSKDSLKIEGEGYYEDIKDSLIIKNMGDIELIIDSIYTRNIFLYPVEIFNNDTSYLFNIVFDQNPDTLTISPQDSIRLFFYIPDLCPICEGSSFSNFEDTLYFRSNSIDNSIYQIYVSGQGLTDVKGMGKLSNKHSLEQNYPNPFNPITQINYMLDKSSNITIEIFDVLGRSIQKLYDGFMNVGSHTLQFDGTRFASGVYYYQLRIGSDVFSKRMLLIK